MNDSHMPRRSSKTPTKQELQRELSYALATIGAIGREAAKLSARSELERAAMVPWLVGYLARHSTDCASVYDENQARAKAIAQ